MKNLTLALILFALPAQADSIADLKEAACTGMRDAAYSTMDIRQTTTLSSDVMLAVVDQQTTATDAPETIRQMLREMVVAAWAEPAIADPIIQLSVNRKFADRMKDLCDRTLTERLLQEIGGN